ncbi:MAG: HD domain-containing phosphohydrolase [Myxococcota bacterium]
MCLESDDGPSQQRAFEVAPDASPGQQIPLTDLGGLSSKPRLESPDPFLPDLMRHPGMRRMITRHELECHLESLVGPQASTPRQVTAAVFRLRPELIWDQLQLQHLGIKVGHFIHEHSRGTDLITTLEGPEAILLMPDQNALEAVRAARRLQQSWLRERRWVADGRLFVGIAELHGPSQDYFRLMEHARVASRRAEAHPDQPIQLYTPPDAASIRLLEQSDGAERVRLLSRFPAVATVVGRRQGPDVLNNLIILKQQFSSFRLDESLRGAELAVVTAQTLQFSALQRQELALAMLIRDTGMTMVPSEKLERPRSLEQHIIGLVQQHPRQSLVWARGLSPSEAVRDAVLYHHECFDGSGYPFHLSGKSLPFLAQLASFCDQLVALIGPRPWRKEFTWTEALELTRSQRGTRFSPAVLDQLMEHKLLESLYATVSRQVQR